MAQSDNLIKELKEKALQVRKDILFMTYTAGCGHPGGSLSETEILVALYFYKLNIDPKRPDWQDRDRFVLSKGHASPGLYSCLANRGFFKRDELKNFRKLNSILQGHTDIKVPGVEMSGGSLGQGLSFANGIAFAGRIDKKTYKVYVLMGDGEQEEGQIWEAAMTASHYKLNNLVAIVDKNKIQNDTFVKDTKMIDPLGDKYKAFGWDVIEVDGHNFEELINTLDSIDNYKDKPVVIIANTIKGKGVSFMENNPEFHGKAPNTLEYEKALKELG